MRVVLAPFGSRGDVAPLLALGQALRARGHGVLVVAPENFAAWAGGLGFEFRRGGPDFRPFFDGTQSEPSVLGRVTASVRETFPLLLDAARGADWIVGSMISLAAPSVATLVGARYAYVTMSPLYLKNDELSFNALPLRRHPRWVGRALWALTNLLGRAFAGSLDAERARHGLGPAGALHPHLIGRDVVFLASDPELRPLPESARRLTPAQILQTGAWVLDEPAVLDPDLESFLAAGRPPVYLGFGSMRHRDHARLGRIVREAVSQAGARLVLARGWSDIGEGFASRESIVLDETPHAALFPRMAAVVHHGGAGTTATALRAGVPQVIVPHLGDQYDQGYRIQELGLGPAPVLQRSIAAGSLARALNAALGDGAMRDRARAMAERLRGKNGASRAAEALEPSSAL